MSRAWSVARAQTKTTNGRHSRKERKLKPNSLYPESFIAVMWRRGVCYNCRKKGIGMRVGRLPLSGNVYFCKSCAGKYQDDKKYEAEQLRKYGD